MEFILEIVLPNYVFLIEFLNESFGVTFNTMLMKIFRFDVIIKILMNCM